MDRVGRRYRYSASDVVAAIACAHKSEMERRVAAALVERPADRDDPMLKLAVRHGFAHEARFLDDLRGAGLRIAVVEPDRSDSRTLLRDAVDTLQFMDSGNFDVIYQPTFVGRSPSGKVQMVGHADFLVRHPRTGALEIVDTKLARRLKAGVPVQLAVYSEFLRGVTGEMPEQMHVVLGNGELLSLRTADYASYTRAAMHRLEDLLVAPGTTTYPERNDHCGVCAWWDDCNARWVQADDLLLVRRMRVDHRQKLQAAGVQTVEQLATLDPELRIPGVGRESVVRLNQQARLQRQHDATGSPAWEFALPVRKGHGLYNLTEPRLGDDLYLDLEVNPFAGNEGFLYLAVLSNLGVDGTVHTRYYWADDVADEQGLFERLIDDISTWISNHPDAQVHHWGHFDEDELIRQAGKHGTRDEKLDALLEGKRFVDLYKRFEQGIRFSGRSYGLKKVEHLFDENRREVEIESGAVSVEWHQNYLDALDEGDVETAKALKRELIRYCVADVDSLPKGHRWLWQRRLDLDGYLKERGLRALPAERSFPPWLATSEIAKEAMSLRRRLKRGLPVDMTRANDDELARARLRELVYWHKREARPEYAAYKRRVEMSPAELVDEPGSVGELRFLGTVDEIDRSNVYRYGFDPAQEYRFAVGDKVIDPATEKYAGTIVGLDPVAGTVDLKRGRTSSAPHPEAIIPPKPVDTKTLRAALHRVALHVLEHGSDGGARYGAAFDLLLARPPRFSDGVRTGALAASGDPVADVVALARDLDRGVLPVQGPPGTGKTYVAAKAVRALVRDGKRVAVTGPSHQAITNLLDEIARQARDDHEWVPMLQKSSDGSARSADEMVVALEDRSKVMTGVDERELDGAFRYPVVAGTAWLFADEALHEKFDTIVVDEAGQVSLANAIAVSGAAKSMMLVGDQQQLQQVTAAWHPMDMGASALEHLLGEHETIPADRGVFLNQTRRCAPELTAFLSPMFYEDRLVAHPDTAQQGVHGDDLLAGSGVRWIEVAHRGQRVRSDYEATRVAEVVASLVGRDWTDQHGAVRPIVESDIIVLTPFNAQLVALRSALPRGVRCGTVDRFQGAGGAVAIYSMATSSPELAPGGLNFLYSRERLNVALSRARALAVVVASPELLAARCYKADQVRMVNALGAAHEYASFGHATPEAIDLEPARVLSWRVGELARRRRAELGISQRVVAERAGVARSTIGAFERGERVPSDNTVARMADALGWDHETTMKVLRGEGPTTPTMNAIVDLMRFALDRTDGSPGGVGR